MSAPETELKFPLSPDALASLGQHPAFRQPSASTSRLKSVYFDTRTRALKKAGLGLRVRSADGRLVQTLKGEGLAGPVERREWETEVEREKPDRGALENTPAAKFLRDDDRLAPVFTTDVERTIRRWTDGSNVIEISVDEGEIVAARRRERLSELELELKAGEPRALFDLADDIVKTFPVRLSLSSKAARGYQLASGKKPEALKSEPICGSGVRSAGDFFQMVAWNCLDQIAKNAEILATRRKTEALHQMRVGLRRFRAALTVFRDMLQGPDLAVAKKETKWLADQLDQARDLDVFIAETFQPAFVADKHRSGYAELGAHLLKAQSAAYQRAIAAIESPRYAHFLLKTAAWLEIGDWLTTRQPMIRSQRERPADDLAREQLDRLRRKVVNAPKKLQKLDEAERHKLRIQAKKLRYAGSFFAEAFPGRKKQQRRFSKELARLQDALGELQDVVVARDLAGDLVREKSPQAGLAAGLMVGARECEADIDPANTALGRLRRMKRFWR